MNYPDDAHLLADGKFITADIRNCRVLIVDPKTDAVTTQWGTPGKCKHNPPSELAYPNGATPLENGDILVTEITDAWISRITRDSKVLWSVKAPGLHYPSDAFPTVDGNGLPGGDRTPDPQLRRLMLYPTELRAETLGAVNSIRHRISGRDCRVRPITTAPTKRYLDLASHGSSVYSTPSGRTCPQCGNLDR
jgi:hypothetical protein